MDEIKNKVKTAVFLYKDIYRDEYNAVVKQLAEVKKNLKNEDAEVMFDDGREPMGLKREIYRIPEKLYALIISNIDEKQWPELDSKEYTAWFIKEFPEFKITKSF